MSESKSPQQLQEENSLLDKKLKQAEKDLESAMNLNAELQDKLEATKSSSNTKKPMVKINNQNYAIVYSKAMVPVNGEMIVKTAEQIAADKELCKSLISIGSKILKAIK